MAEDLIDPMLEDALRRLVCSNGHGAGCKDYNLPTGRVRLLRAQPDLAYVKNGPRPGNGWWVTRAGMEAARSGRLGRYAGGRFDEAADKLEHTVDERHQDHLTALWEAL